ncbi:hypothetical protein ABIC09_007405 [Bradyrhizobium sp. S3.12.5]
MAQEQLRDRFGQTTQDRSARGAKMDLFSFIECAKKTRSLKALFDLLVSCSSEQGFSQVAYGALTDAKPSRLPGYLSAAVTVNFPSDWCERYSERRYSAIDPVVQRTTMLSAPFLWDQLADQYKLQAGETRVLKPERPASSMALPYHCSGHLDGYLSYRLRPSSTMPTPSIASVISTLWLCSFIMRFQRSRLHRRADAIRKYSYPNEKRNASGGWKRENRLGKSESS